MDNVTEKINNFRRPYGVLVAEQLAADLVRDERDARIEAEERSVREDAILREGAATRDPMFVPACERCGIELGIGRNKCAPAKSMETICLECATLYDPPLTPDEECFL